MGKNDQAKWLKLRERILKRGGPMADEIRRLQSLTPEQLAAESTEIDRGREKLLAELDAEHEAFMEQYLADDAEFEASRKQMIAELDADLKPILRRLRKTEREDNARLEEALRRYERGDPAADAAEDAAADLGLRAFLDWQRRRR